MSIEVWRKVRLKGRPPCWAFRVTDGERVVFQSSRVSLRLLSASAAAWVAGLVDALGGSGRPLVWRGDLKDDGSACWKDLGAHAEHLFGPRRGGLWYASVFGAGGSLFLHTAEQADVQPRSGAAARWLCELVISAAEAGVTAAYE